MELKEKTERLTLDRREMPKTVGVAAAGMAAGALTSAEAAETGSCTDPDCRHQHPDRDHSKAFSSWSHETDQPFSLEALRQAASKLPANIHRAKGVIYAADEPERRAVLQVVGRRVDISLEDELGDRPARTQIVAIGAPAAVDQEALRERFERCLSNSDGRSAT